ncbi:hypothetical protein [Actinoplanes sp. NPDC049599]|uniref:hypothetical protein n=1 Tax=Actinoplanes sp. NPDC049599 TaxID=3363903 RepID=UPI00378EDA75
MAITGSANSIGAQSAVVLVNGAGGRELDTVHDLLTRALGTPAVLLNHRDLARVPLSLDLATGVLHVHGRRVRPVVVWARHTSAAALAVQVPGLRVLDAVSWSGLFTHLAATADAALPGSAPAGPGQLTDAERLGVRVPRTVLSTAPERDAGRVTAVRAVVKTQDFRLYEPDRRRWPGARPRLAGDAAGPDQGRPMVLQEYVAHVRELRVYYLNGGICAFEIDKPGPASPWTEPDRVTVTRVDCPAEARTAVGVLCAAWSLRFGAFDLLVSHTREVVFLEVNPDGDWLWFEHRARWHGVSFMAAVMVRELFIQGTSSGAHADDHSTG